MPASVQAIGVARNGAGFNVTFSDGSGMEFGDLADMRTFGEEIESVENCKRFLVARWLKADSDASDTAAIMNRTCSINAGAPNPVQIG